jgi:hypothetical protein
MPQLPDEIIDIDVETGEIVEARLFEESTSPVKVEPEPKKKAKPKAKPKPKAEKEETEEAVESVPTSPAALLVVVNRATGGRFKNLAALLKYLREAYGDDNWSWPAKAEEDDWAEALALASDTSEEAASDEGAEEEDVDGEPTQGELPI